MRIPSGCSKLERAIIIDRVKGMIFGAILGDSLGLATEGMSREQVQKAYSNGPIRFGMDDDQESAGVNFIRDTFRSLFDENDFGDDAEQQLLILFSIQENRGTFNYKDYATRLYNYSNRGMRGLDKQPLGIKATTKSVLSRPHFLESPHPTAIDVWRKEIDTRDDSGSLVRAAILGVPKFWDGTTVIQNSAECCRITHPDPRSVISSVIVSTIVARMLRGQDLEMEILDSSQPSPLPSPLLSKPNQLPLSSTKLPPTPTSTPPTPTSATTPTTKWTDSLETDRVLMSLVRAVIDANKRILTAPNTDPLFQTPETDANLMQEYFEQLIKTCYQEPLQLSPQLLHESHVFSCLGGASYVFTRVIPKGSETEYFKRLLMDIVMQGGHADANGSVAGALLGLRIGYGCLPSEWVVGLKRWEWLEDRVEEFCEML
ncbi:hypothetical protein PHYBLDRAFT_186254 [Phycomyces blakesleeanus NRRL 1555(-)]|uniref:ADP-ribosylglycohydrolase n=1 Tax=Phycomyces blakesleeanus (strain ATCC 8743b / DSM 1359 / FGSC 10004 / NBRC 33097 / NRRL 1555) TaxID=763407 RepID=A0A162Q1L2_PHYB8|nr:hypothetical protein PHYBLDRAFT_186254 [Phycomyces blakesleeanus NRRL 1555(-)]OAD76366.1 hypothetical protein PHYBLDRAFT_186254 [Phycomyces blakesleeanus NRRL 1555(-)]|eukprot:XP_018294406.1 hypothetical protein PHYBLDRAFT_186254 [Phycomyces blakesleeanus NRRL 1555(-)]